LLARCPGHGPSRSSALGCMALDVPAGSSAGFALDFFRERRVHVLTDA
jgi:hypothetical protein